MKVYNANSMMHCIPFCDIQVLICICIFVYFVTVLLLFLFHANGLLVERLTCMMIVLLLLCL